jgi:hypothetical protein
VKSTARGYIFTMGRRRNVTLLVYLLAIAIAAGATSTAASRDTAAPPLRGVNFISVCAFSHRAPDDPIVLPRQPGFSHDHTFVGNTSTDAFSTPARLRAAGTTCRRHADTAAYWMPTLFVGRDPVSPTTAIAYYRRATRVPVKPFPAGLQIVAGNAGSNRPQSLVVTYWDCGDLVNVPRSSDVPSCSDGTLSLHVNFPDCWDGKSLLSENQRHMAYSVNGRCPAGHRVPLPALSLVYRYPVTTTTATVSLASGGQYSGHADFVNAWNQQVLASLVSSCLNRYRHCGAGT